MSDSNKTAKPKAKAAKPTEQKTAPRKRAPRKRKTETAAPVQPPAAIAHEAAAVEAVAAAPAAEARPAQAERVAAPAQAQPAAAQLVESVAVAPAALIRVPLSVRWRDLDAFNHVNNSKFLSYLEEARLRWMVTLPGHGMDEHVAPVVAAAHLNYRRPIEWPNEIDIELFVERLGNTSLSIGHRIVGASDPGAVYCDGNVVMVWIHRETGQPAALPEPVRRACTPR